MLIEKWVLMVNKEVGMLVMIEVMSMLTLERMIGMQVRALVMMEVMQGLISELKTAKEVEIQ